VDVGRDSKSRAETRKGERRLRFERMKTGSVKLRKNKITGRPGSGSFGFGSGPELSNSASASPSFCLPLPWSSCSGASFRAPPG